jgi:hypothetical protein
VRYLEPIPSYGLSGGRTISGDTVPLSYMLMPEGPMILGWAYKVENILGHSIIRYWNLMENFFFIQAEVLLLLPFCILQGRFAYVK